jgi:hypothetical protein
VLAEERTSKKDRQRIMEGKYCTVCTLYSVLFMLSDKIMSPDNVLLLT